MLHHSRDLDLTWDRFLILTWLTLVLTHNVCHLLCMLQPVILIRPISLDLKKIWPVYLKLSFGLIWVAHVFIKNHILLSLILFHILLVGIFSSLLNLMVIILVQLGSMLAMAGQKTRSPKTEPKKPEPEPKKPEPERSGADGLARGFISKDST